MSTADEHAHFVRQDSTFERLGEQQTLDSAVVFRAGAASSYVTGVTLAVDGGTSGH